MINRLYPNDESFLAEKKLFFGKWLSAVIFLVAFILTIGGTLFSKFQIEKEKMLLFDSYAREFKEEMQHHFSLFEEILLGGKALFSASKSVERKEWFQYIKVLSQKKSLISEIEGVGFLAYVLGEEKDAFENTLQQDGFPDFKIEVNQKRNKYFLVKYVEPFEKNKKILGQDLGEFPSCEASILEACDSNKLQIAPNVVFKKQGLGNKYIFLFLPVYQHNRPLNRSEEKEAFLVEGLVFICFYLDDFIEKLLLKENFTSLNIEIFDQKENKKLFESSSQIKKKAEAFKKQFFLKIAGRNWILTVSSSIAPFHFLVKSSLPLFVFILGTIFSLLISGLVWNLTRTRSQAITIANKMTEKLHYANMLQRTILDSVSYSIISTNIEGNIQTFNKTAENWLGYQKEEIIQKPFLQLMANPEEIKSRAQKIAEEANVMILPGFDFFFMALSPFQLTTEQYEWDFLRKNASRFPVNLSVAPLRNEKEGLVGFLCVANDISRQKNMEKALSQNTKKTELILDHVLDGIITITQKGIIETFNPSAELIFGYTPQEVVGKNVKMLMPEPYFKEHDSYLENYLRTNNAKIIGIGREVTGKQKNGKTFPMELAITEFFLEKERIFIGIVRDITARKENENALIQNQARLKLLNSIATNIHFEMSFEQIIKNSLQQISLLFPSYRVAYSTINSQCIQKLLYSVQPQNMPKIEAFVFDLNTVPDYLDILTQKQILALEDVSQDPSFSLFGKGIIPEGISAVLHVSLHISKELIGLIYLDSEYPHHWNKHEIATLKEVAQFLSLTLKETKEREERKKTELEIKKFFQLSLDVLCIANLDGYFKRFNPSFEEALGYSKIELLKKPFVDFIHPDDISKTLEELEKLAKGKITVFFENRFRCQDGSYKLFSWKVIPEVETGMLYAVARDVTEERKFQEEIQKLSLIASKTENAVILTDSFGSIEWVNDGFSRLYGYTLEETLQEQFDSFLQGPFTNQETIKRVRDKIQEKVAFTEEIFNYHKNGEAFWISMSITPILNSEGEVNRFIVIESDITKLKESEKKLQEYNNSLRKTNQELDQFAYVVSHDLKAPLRAINNLAEWIVEDAFEVLDEDSKKNLELLQKRVHRMEELINGILKYSYVDRVKSEEEEINIQELLKEVVELLSPPTEFFIHFQIALPSFYTEKIKLFQVFSNLIGNAVKYHHRSKGNIWITAKETEHFYEFRVKDDGPGIESKYHEKIFVVFQKLEARDEVESTGIGLAIVKKIIEANGGKVWVESKPEEEGTTFCFTWLKKIEELKFREF